MEKPEAAIAVSSISTDPPPKWLSRIVNRQIKINKQYELAKGLVATAYNDLLDAITEINAIHGTNFSIHEIYGEYGEDYAPDAVEREEDEED